MRRPNKLLSAEKAAHDAGLEKLLHAPKTIGIRAPVIWSARQIQIYKDTYPQLITDIDLLYYTNSDVWIAEYKIVPGYLSKARRQLDLGAEFVKERFNTVPRRLYVVGPGFLYTEL